MKEKISIKEKGTSVSANSLIWFGAGVSIAEILDRHIVWRRWDLERAGSHCAGAM